MNTDEVKTTGENQSIHWKTCPSATLSNYKSHMNWLGINRGSPWRKM